MGDNSFGQLGIGFNPESSRGINEENEFDFKDTPTKIEGLSNIIQIASGHHSAALT